MDNQAKVPELFINNHRKEFMAHDNDETKDHDTYNEPE